eukprot:535381-Rhodomonas_salina.1
MSSCITRTGSNPVDHLSAAVSTFSSPLCFRALCSSQHHPYMLYKPSSNFDVTCKLPLQLSDLLVIQPEILEAKI